MAVGIAWFYGEMVADVMQGWMKDLLQALVFLFALLVGYFLYLPLARILLAPLAESLSRRAHQIHTGDRYASPGNGLRAIREGVKLVVLHIVIGVFALGLGIVFPPIGAPVGILIAVFLCGLDFFDIPLSAQGHSLARKLKLIFTHKSLALGFGAAAYLMLLIPGLNLLLLPAGVVGATLLTDAIERR
jgi:CysZ protein